MKKVLLSLLAIVTFAMTGNAQNIIDAEDGHNPNDFYQQGLVVGKKAMPYPYLRESDVVWKTTIWRNIDMNETFNQFFYFPFEQEKNTQGRINLVNLIIDNASKGEFDVYEDDDMKVPQEWGKVWAGMQGKRIAKSYAEEEDEFGDFAEYFDTVPDPFDPATPKLLQLKEYWYIDKQDTRQKVRIVGLSFRYSKNMLRAGKSEESTDWSFWVPMNEMNVRQVLVNANAFEASNDVTERSYDDIFIQRYFDSYITRESNVYNRAIDQYLTGEDAILESQVIENKIFEIESDMWEY